jgi:hypothetical protein
MERAGIELQALSEEPSLVSGSWTPHNYEPGTTALPPLAVGSGKTLISFVYSRLEISRIPGQKPVIFGVMSAPLPSRDCTAEIPAPTPSGSAKT